MGSTRLEYLFEHYDAGLATASETTELFDWLANYENRDEALEFLASEIRNTEEQTQQNIQKWRPVIEKILEVSPTPVRWLNSLKRIAVAASIALLLAAAYFFIFKHSGKKHAEIANTNHQTFHDITAPKNTKATINLSDGHSISIDSLTLLQQSTVNLKKALDGSISYSGNTSETIYNTLTNPRGSAVVNMELSDGSKVWLNAGSSITYPIAFKGSERRVTMTGEAYFEISHNAVMPFRVSKGNTVVSVLGTHFNINAYDDEPSIKVTLLEGAVKINNYVIIKPGQQAQVAGDIKVMDAVNIDEVMAWKNGIFLMDKTDVATILRQVARWYDVDIEYRGAIPQGRITGDIPREMNLAKVLEVMEISGVKLSIDGRKVIVE